MIRKAKIEDSNSIANLILRGWQTAYKGLIDQELLDDMKEDEMSKGWKKNIFSQNLLSDKLPAACPPEPRKTFSDPLPGNNSALFWPLRFFSG